MMVTVVVSCFVYDVYSFWGIEYFQMRGIRGQFIHPGLFETDIADAQVGGAFIQIDQLLG